MRSLAFNIAFVVLGALFAEARDLGQYAQMPQELREWFGKLTNRKKELCCSDADGYDAQWDTKDGKYRVNSRDGWVEVPDDAMVDTINRTGVAKVWWYFENDKRKVRCFMKGTEG